MHSLNKRTWLIAILLGSFVNLGFFLFLPTLGRSEPSTPPQIIELDLIAWQQPVKKEIIPQKKKPIKPKKIRKQKPKPKPKKKLIKPVPKPTPKPVLAKQVIPDKSVPPIKPVERPTPEPSPIAPTAPPAKKTKIVEEALPIPTPIFKLTKMPRMIHRQTPVYPLSMKQQGKNGTVKLAVLLDIKGKVRKITVIKSAGIEFDEAAINAIKKSTFRPANIEGKPVAVLLKLPVKFRLR